MTHGSCNLQLVIDGATLTVGVHPVFCRLLALSSPRLQHVHARIGIRWFLWVPNVDEWILDGNVCYALACVPDLTDNVVHFAIDLPRCGTEIVQSCEDFRQMAGGAGGFQVSCLFRRVSVKPDDLACKEPQEPWSVELQKL